MNGEKIDSHRVGLFSTIIEAELKLSCKSTDTIWRLNGRVSHDAVPASYCKGVNRMNEIKKPKKPLWIFYGIALAVILVFKATPHNSDCANLPSDFSSNKPN